MADIHDRLVRCFTAVFPDLSPSEIEQASTSSVAAWDSLANATLVTVVEEEFDVEIPAEQLDRLASFRQLLDHLSAGRGAA